MPPKASTAKTPAKKPATKKVVLDLEPPSTLQQCSWNLISALERHGTADMSIAANDALSDLKRVSEYQPPAPAEP